MFSSFLFSHGMLLSFSSLRRLMFCCRCTCVDSFFSAASRVASAFLELSEDPAATIGSAMAANTPTNTNIAMIPIFSTPPFLLVTMGFLVERAWWQHNARPPQPLQEMGTDATGHE